MSVQNNWVGAVDDGSAWVRAKIDGTNGELFISTSSDMSDEESAGTDSSDNSMVSIEATGLDSDTLYFFQVDDDGERGPTGKFRTYGTIGEPYSYTFAAFGDAGLDPDNPGDTGDELDPDRVSNHPAFSTVRDEAKNDRSILFVAHLGDLHYYNLGDDHDGTVDNYRRAYDDVLAQPRQHELYYRVPLVYSWDDHDYGPNNSDRTHSDRDNAAQVYRERVPHYSLAESSGPIYHSFQVGRVLHIVSDVRYNRDPNSDPQSSDKTMLGTDQKSWMDSLLADTDAAALIWHMPSQWMGTSSDSWSSFRDERDDLVDMFGDRGFLDRMCIISADVHALAMDSGANNRWGGFPVYQLASIDCSSGDDPTQYDLGGSSGRGRYGTIDVTDQAGIIRVVATGRIDGDLWQQHTWFNQKPTRTTIPTLGLDYTKQHISPPTEPTEDDQNIVNDVTVEREEGSEARARQNSGPLSIDPPPDGVGRYDESVTLNVASDDVLPDQAGWRVHLGTVDEPRYPEVTVSLTRNSDLTRQVARVDSGDRVTIANPPGWLPPGDIEMVAQGYTETITPYSWDWTLNSSPGSAWTVAQIPEDSTGEGSMTDGPFRFDTDDSEISEAIGDDTTEFDVDVIDGAPWITDDSDPDDFPFDVVIGGEVMRVTGIVDDSSTIEESFDDDDECEFDIGDGGSDEPWSRDTSDTNPVFKSGDIDHEETSDAVVTIPTSATSIRFWYAVDSEQDFDFLRVLVGNTEVLAESGNVDWTESDEYDLNGADTVTFRYEKDIGTSSGEDAAWIDDVVFTIPRQAFTVERGINGVRKQHATGEAVTLVTPAVIAL